MADWGCHTPLHLLPGEGLSNRQARPQLPAATRCCGSCAGNLQRAVSVVTHHRAQPPALISATAQHSRHLDSARAALRLQGYLVPLAEAGAKGNTVLMCRLRSYAAETRSYRRRSACCTAAGMMRDGQIFPNSLQKQTPEPHNAQKEHPASAHWGGKPCDDEGWKSVSSGARRKLFLHPGSAPWQQARGWELCKMTRLCQLSLNPAAAPEVGEEGGELPAAGDRAPSCQPVQGGVPGAQTWDGAGRLMRLLQPPDYDPLLLFHAGTSSTAKGNWECVKSDHVSLGVMAKGGPGGPLLNPAGEEEGLQERWMDSVGQYAAAGTDNRNLAFIRIESSLRNEDLTK